MDGFKKKKLWEEIATKAEVTIASTKLAEKYGNLLGEFRKHKELAKSSGNGAIKWSYFNKFSHVMGNDLGGEPHVKVEVGGRDSVITINDQQTERKRNSNIHKGKKVKQSGMKVQINGKKLLLLDKFLKGDDDNMGIRKELETNNKRMDNMNNKLNDILKLLKKD